MKPGNGVDDFGFLKHMEDDLVYADSSDYGGSCGHEPGQWRMI